MEAHRQPENRLKGLLRHPGGTSWARSRAKPHRIKAAAHRHATRTTGHSVYANDNPVRFSDPNGRQGISFGMTQAQLDSIAKLSQIQSEMSVAEAAVRPRSIILTGGVSAEGGSPFFGGKGQVEINIVIPLTLHDLPFTYVSVNAGASGELSGSPSPSMVGLNGKSQVIGGDIGTTISAGITNMTNISQSSGISTTYTVNSPIPYVGGGQIGIAKNGAWSAQLTSTAAGLSYSKQDVWSGSIGEVMGKLKKVFSD